MASVVLGSMKLFRCLTPLFLLCAALVSAQPHTTFDGKMRASGKGYDEAYIAPIEKSSHAANLLQLRNGDLLCFWFSGSSEGKSGVAIVASRLHKSHWARPIVIDRQMGYSFQNPVPFETPSGDILLLHTAQPEKEGQSAARVLMVRSRDHGKSWSQPQVVFDQPGAFVRSPLLVRPDGAWLLPMYYTPTSAITTGAESHYPVVKISTDQGNTWQECSIPHANGLVQPTVVRQKDHYVAFFRSRFADHIYRATSPDGCAWSTPQATELPNNNASIQAVALRNGHIAMVFNNTHAEPVTGKPATGVRAPLTVAISTDEGLTWPAMRNLETGLRSQESEEDYRQHVRQSNEYDEYSYPSILQSRSGDLWAAFSWRRQTIKIMRFNEDWASKTPRP